MTCTIDQLRISEHVVFEFLLQFRKLLNSDAAVAANTLCDSGPLEVKVANEQFHSLFLNPFAKTLRSPRRGRRGMG